MDAAFIRAEPLMMLFTATGFLDLFYYVPRLPSAPVRDAWASAMDLDGIRLVSLPWLRTVKQASGRPKDMLDPENLPPAPRESDAREGPLD